MSLKNILQGRPFGHPLHPLVVHLPLGMWLFALLLDIADVGMADTWAVAPAFISLLVGTAAALVAVLSGLTDWWEMRADHPGQKAAFWHMCLMVPATILFCLDTLLHYSMFTHPGLVPLGLALSAVAYALCLVGGYLGGRLVYQDGISVGRHRRTLPLPHHTLVAPAPQADTPAGLHAMFPESALPEGGTLRTECEGTVVTFARAEGRIYAVQEYCTHRCGPLSEGTVCGSEITCPWHGSKLDLRSGKPTHGPAKVELKTFEVEVQRGIVHLRLAPKADAPGAETRVSPRRNPQDTPQRPADSPRIANPQNTTGNPRP